MRNITEIVIHHSLTPRDLDLDASMSSFDRTHKEYLYEQYQQPISNGDLKHIAYHYCIGADGTTKMGRTLDVPGWHASKYEVNLSSIGVCLLGDFDEEEPTQEQYSALEDLIVRLKKEFPAITLVSGHRYYANKSCPGKNFTDSMISYFNDLLNKPAPWWEEARDWAIENNLTNGERPADTVTRAELWQTMKNASDAGLFGFDL